MYCYERGFRLNLGTLPLRIPPLTQLGMVHIFDQVLIGVQACRESKKTLEAVKTAVHHVVATLDEVPIDLSHSLSHSLFHGLSHGVSSRILSQSFLDFIVPHVLQESGVLHTHRVAHVLLMCCAVTLTFGLISFLTACPQSRLDLRCTTCPEGERCLAHTISC